MILGLLIQVAAVVFCILLALSKTEKYMTAVILFAVSGIKFKYCI